jgi:hypothetical protein
MRTLDEEWDQMAELPCIIMKPRQTCDVLKF